MDHDHPGRVGLLLSILLLAACAPKESPTPDPTSHTTLMQLPTAGVTVSPSPEPTPTASLPPAALQGHTGPVTQLAWSPDGLMLVSTSASGEIIEWDALTRQRLTSFSTCAVSDMLFTETGLFMYVCPVDPSAESGGGYGSSLMVHDYAGAPFRPSPVQTLSTYEGIHANSLAYMMMGGSIIVIGADEGVLLASSMWQSGPWEDTSLIVDFPGAVTHVRAYGWRAVLGTGEGQVYVMEVTGLGYRLWEHDAAITAMHLLPPSEEGGLHNLASGSADGTIRIGDITDAFAAVRPDGQPATPLVIPAAHGAVTDLAWSPDSGTLATSYEDGTVLLRDAEEGEAVEEKLIGGGGNAALSVAWSPDGATLAIGLQDGSIHLWAIR